MPLADYQVAVISPVNGQVIRIFDSQSFVSLHYSIALNDIGALVLTFNGQDDLTDLFPLDAIIDVQRRSAVTNTLQKEESYFARLTHRIRESGFEQFIVGGLSLNHILSRRLIDPADDPLQAGGYSTKAGNSDSVMREYALEQMVTASIDRRMPDFIVNTVPGVGVPVGARLRYDNLYEVMQDLAARGGVDFTVRRTTGRAMQMTIAPIGTNKTYDYNYPFSPFVILDPNRGNLSNPSILLDRKKEANFGYFLGQGPGEQRITLQLAGDGISDSPWNRIEMKGDARQAERDDPIALLTQARTKLKEEAAKIEFTFDLSGQEPGAQYKVDFSIGDLITAQWDSVRVDLRIIGVEFDIDQSGESIKVLTELP